jgi:hypothetical protein
MAKEETPISSSPRDFILARLAVARAHAARIAEGIETTIDLFIFPDADEEGAARIEGFEELLDDIGGLTRAVDAAQGACAENEEFDWTEGEPDFDAEDEDDEEDAA